MNFEGSNLERLAIKGVDYGMIGLAMGVNLVRQLVWCSSLDGPPQQAQISYFPDLHESEEQERQLSA